MWLSESELIAKHSEYGHRTMISALHKLGYLRRRQEVRQLKRASGSTEYYVSRKVWVYDEDQWVTYWEATLSRAAILADLREANGYEERRPGRGHRAH